MLFDFGFNLTPSIEKIKTENKKKALCRVEARLRKLSQSKSYSKKLIDFIRQEIDLKIRLKVELEEIQNQG